MAGISRLPSVPMMIKPGGQITGRVDAGQLRRLVQPDLLASRGPTTPTRAAAASPDSSVRTALHVLGQRAEPPP